MSKARKSTAKRIGIAAAIAAAVIAVAVGVAAIAGLPPFAPNNIELTENQRRTMIMSLICNEIGEHPFGDPGDGVFVFGDPKGVSGENITQENETARYLDVIKLGDCKIYGVRSQGGRLIAYIWFVHDSYTCLGGKVYSCGSGGSYPLRVTMIDDGGTLTVTDIEEPRDGGLYDESIRAMMPWDIYLQIRAENLGGDGDIAAIQKRMSDKAAEYFGCPLSGDLLEIDTETGGYEIIRISEGVNDSGEYFFDTDVAESGTLPLRDTSGLPEDAYRPAELLYLGPWSSYSEDYFMQCASPAVFTLGDGLFSVSMPEGEGCMFIGDISVDSPQYVSCEPEQSSFGEAMPDGEHIKVLTAEGDDTGYRIVRSGGEMYIAHYGLYGEKGDALWCEYIFKLG